MEKIIVALIVVLALAYSISRLWRTMRSGSCACGHGQGESSLKRGKNCPNCCREQPAPPPSGPDKNNI
jgi:hypothetical protein